MPALRKIVLGVLFAALTLAAVPSPAIVGGSPASNGEYPWMAAIYTGSPSSGQYCGGSLIEPRYVVTAAHCIDELLDNAIAGLPIDLLGMKVSVLIGQNALNGTGGERITATRLVVDPDSNEDVAVLTLARASTRTPISIARPGQEAYWAPGIMATVTGWGATSEGGRGSNVLLEAQVPVVSDAKCAQAYRSLVARTMVCAGYDQGGVDTCQGDSGGPMMVPGPGSKPLLAGITSFGEGCARPGFPGVYAEVAAAADFIDAQTP